MLALVVRGGAARIQQNGGGHEKEGEGLHHAMYGEVDRHTGRVVQKGRFDMLFDDFIKQAPPELRAGLASRKPALREAGSVRMAVRQLERRSQYEQDHLAAVQAEELDAIAKSDPDDMPAFETARRAGLGLIAKMNLDYRKCSFRTSAQ